MLFVLAFTACNAENDPENKTQKKEEYVQEPDKLTDKDWKEKLTDEEYRVLRKKGTERPYTGKYDDHFEPGVYVCSACGAELFSSDTKFDAHCGWPSFYDEINNKNIEEKPDYSHGMVRTEVVCANCGGHLGHVFNDGPEPTGLRYCINSVSLNFKKKDEDRKD